MRYAIYYSPAQDHPLTQCASRWLGRNAYSGEIIATDHGLDAFLTSPKKYGFHGTLKAPFKLANSVYEEDLIELFDQFASEHTAFTLKALTLAQIGPFFALVSAEADDALQSFAESVVRGFEPMRAPLSHADIERRNPSRLTPAQWNNLQRWGYPYVMDEFRFHLTLTGPVDTAQSGDVETAIKHHFDGFINAPLTIDTIALFTEPRRGDPFTVLRTACLSKEKEEADHEH